MTCELKHKVASLKSVLSKQAASAGCDIAAEHFVVVDNNHSCCAILNALQHSAVIDQIDLFVDSHEVFIHHVHSKSPLILIVLSRLDRGIQSATEMLPL